MTAMITAGAMRGYQVAPQSGQTRVNSVADGSVRLPQRPQKRCDASHSSSCAARPAAWASAGGPSARSPRRLGAPAGRPASGAAKTGSPSSVPTWSSSAPSAPAAVVTTARPSPIASTREAGDGRAPGSKPGSQLTGRSVLGWGREPSRGRLPPLAGR